MKKKRENLLMVADSVHDANMLYVIRMFIPDRFIYLRVRGRSYAVLSDLEIDRARRQAPHCRLLSLTRYQDKLRSAGVKQPGLVHVTAAILRERRIRRLVVPENFPYGLAAELERRNAQRGLPGHRERPRAPSRQSLGRLHVGRDRMVKNLFKEFRAQNDLVLEFAR